MNRQHQLDSLLEEIRREYRDTYAYTHTRHISIEVESALRDVPRELFVPDEMQPYAFDNRPLPIGCNQTISQPYIVAIMTDLLHLSPRSRVLEIGSGCGYQTAVLAQLAERVFSIEIIPELHHRALDNLGRCGINNCHLRLADGYEGWADEAPFDGIIVTACADGIPPALLQQLSPQGHLVIPLAIQRQQILCVVSLDRSRQPNVEPLLPVRFVPLTRVC